MDPGPIVSAISCVADFTVAPIVKQVKYVLDYKQNMENLPKEVEKLMDLKQEVECLVSSARGNAEDIKSSVEAWMKEANDTAEAARQRIRGEEEQSRRRCFIGLCPNPVSRHRSSRKAFKETVQILQVQTAGREFKEGSVSFPVSTVPSFPVTVTLGKDFLDFNSRSKTWEDIIKALKDPDSNVIGVYGMGGLGKTTLVNQVAARAVEEGLYEVVVPVVTDKNVRDAKGFQEEMAKVLNMKLDDQWNQWTVSQRADRIFKRLTGDHEKTEKKTIIILDDLRAQLDLEKVGIPFGAGIKGCKILFTSRFRYISYATQRDFTLGVLEEEEAWRLFQKIVGDVLEDPAFLHIGKEVTKSCKGLPILIVTVVGALLKRRSLGAWKDALIRLQNEGSKDMQEFVDSALEFISFNHLPAINKSLFLLCGLLGEREIIVSDLLKYGIGWGLFKHTKTMEEARNNLETLILDLKASFLLLDGLSVDFVVMHDVVRDVAIKIASNEDHNMLVGSSEEWHEEDTLKRCTALTFPHYIVPELPECLECPSLELLVLLHNNSILKIVDNTFEKMQKLTVLDITGVDLFPTLPSSLALLQNLQTLCLDHCKLGDISVVGALKKLKILSLICASFETLPMEIGDLSELRVLDLNGCSKLKVIPPGVIQRLSRLEELDMANSFSQWEVEGPSSSESSNASLDELNCLPKLTTLRIRIPDTNLLPNDFSFKKLERFTVLIGDEEWDWTCHDDGSLYQFKGIKIKVNGSRDIHLEAGVKEMIKRTEILYLDGMKSIHELEWKSFRELKFVHIQHSAETRYIVNATEHRTPDRAFPACLESLFLSHLPQLQSLCRARVMESSFSKLKFVNVNNCNSLRTLFSFSMARVLLYLEKVKVTNCKVFEAILEDSGEDGKNDGIESDEIRSEGGCTTVVPFLCEKVIFPRLEELTLSRIPNLTELWPHPCIMSFKNLGKLTVENCASMKYLFTHSTAMALEQVQEIKVKICKSLNEIVTHVEGEETNDTMVFPQLLTLELEGLPCLTRFCRRSSIVFPALHYLSIRECRQFETFVCPYTVKEDKTMKPLFSDKVELPNLKFLHIRNLDNVKTIWHNRLHQHSFFKLEHICIRDCPNLLKIFPSTMLRRVQSLETLYLDNNCLVEEVFENYEMMKPSISGGGDPREDMIKFSRLNEIYLGDLSNLKRFCSGSFVVFPALTKLWILRCKPFETFVYPFGVTDSMRKGVEEVESSDNLIPIMQPLFSEKVEFPSLKELKLGDLDSVKSIWHDGNHEVSFCTLEQLRIWNCANLLRIFPFAMLRRIRNLKALSISYCPLVEEIFEAPRLHMNETVDVMATTQLSDLHLCNLPKLKCLWREDRGQILSFLNLCEVAVHCCQSLEYLFPAPIARQLYHLEQLHIHDCAMETVIGGKNEEEVKEEAAAFMFPKLFNLNLRDLPKLQSFCPGGCTAQWPSLKVYRVTGMFPSDLVKFAGGENQFIKLVSNLVHLATDVKDLMMITRHCDLIPELFSNLKDLRLFDFNDESADCALAFLERFHNLESLNISNCSFQDIFLHGGSVAGEEVKYNDHTLPLLDRLKHLELYQFHKLKSVWKEDSLLVPILEKLESLKVQTCPGLTNIVQGLVSFKFLAVLEVRNCAGLLNLVQISTAKSLVQLTTLKVSGCRVIKEIVACECRDGAEDKVVFSKLKTLELRSLPSLINFCPGNCAFKFPLLQEVIAIECPNMKAFCGGITSSPKLQKVSFSFIDVRDIEEVEWQEDKDLNTIIRMFEEARMQKDANATSSLENHSEPDALICENSTNPSNDSKESGAKTEMYENVTDPGNMAEISTVIVNQDTRAEICDGTEKCSKKVEEINDKFTQLQGEAETCEDAEKRDEEVAEMATEPSLEAESSENVIQSKKNDGICEEVIEPYKAMDPSDDEAISSRKEAYKVDDELRKEGEVYEEIVEPREHNDIREEITKARNVVAALPRPYLVKETQGSLAPTHDNVEAESSEKAIQSIKNDGVREKIIEPTKEVHTDDNEAINSRKEKIDTCKARNEAETRLRPSLLKETQGSLAPTPDIVGKGVELRKEGEFCDETVEQREEIDTYKARNEVETLQRPYHVKGSRTPTPYVTRPSSQSRPTLGSGIGATTCEQNNDFQGLQVKQHLVPLLEKARNKHGDFFSSPLIKLKTMRIIAMETVGQVLHILHTQTPRTINEEKIQFMEDAYHDVSNMRFPIEWLRPLIDKASKTLLSVQRRTVVYELKAKIDEMEAQLQMLKGEMEVEKAKLEEFDEENGSLMDLDQPLLDI